MLASQIIAGGGKRLSAHVRPSSMKRLLMLQVKRPLSTLSKYLLDVTCLLEIRCASSGLEQLVMPLSRANGCIIVVITLDEMAYQLSLSKKVHSALIMWKSLSGCMTYACFKG